MMIKRQYLFLILAIISGIIAVILLNQYIRKVKQSAEIEMVKTIGEIVQVVVARTDIKRGEVISEKMLAMKQIPHKFAQPRSIESFGMVIGKLAAVDIAEGEQITSTKLTTRRTYEGTSLAMRIPSGKRAITLSIDSLSAVGGMVRPGDYVDILGNIPIAQQIEGKTVAQPVMVTLLQNVLVLAVGQEIEKAPVETGREQAKAVSTITFALMPQEAQLIAYAQEQGKIKLILRPPLETATMPVTPVDASILYQYILSQVGIEFPTTEGEQPIAPAGPSVEIYRGEHREEIPLQEK